MEVDEKQQGLMFKLSMFEQQMQQLQQQLQAVEQAIVEMGSLDQGLDELVGSKDKEILAPIGRGIFAKAKLISEELIVDIGGKNLVKKNIPNTKKIIRDQLAKLQEVKKDLQGKLEQVGEKFTKMYTESQEQTKCL